ncbi:AMP phosphorylase [uncultured archaeon]|nr:AMP phosphorylase [uncultured archaeon]
MRLKSKNLRWIAGRPVVILTEKAAKKLNVHVDDRVKVSLNKKSIYAVVDLFEGVVRDAEIGLSKEISSYLRTKGNETLEISTAEMFLGAKIIKKKLDGASLTKEEIVKVVSEITNNNLTETEIAYFVSAEKNQGMTLQETIYLTEAMINSGKHIHFKDKIVADKHCIGGIAGNRTTPIVVSICTAAGLKMPKSSSRAITSASGTADVMETIANVELSTDKIKKIVDKTNGCLVWGGSLGLAPSDDKIIQVERILNLDVEPQLLASIISKKISAGSNRIVVDIPYGGGKMKTKGEAKALGDKFAKIGKHFNVKFKPVYTDGTQPIGNGFGPVLEMQDVLSVLRNEPDCPQDLKKKSLYLAAEIMSLCGIYFAGSKAKKILESGEAYKKFKEIVNAQNESKDFDKRVKSLSLAKVHFHYYSPKSGKVVEINNQKINSLCRILGTPENPRAGVYLHRHLGKVKEGDDLLTLYSESEERLKDAEKFLLEYQPIKIV